MLRPDTASIADHARGLARRGSGGRDRGDDWLARLAHARRSVAWIGAAVIGATVALAAYDIVRGYHERVEATGRELDSQARVIAEQTARSIQAVDVVLRHLVEQFDAGVLSAMSREQLHLYLKEQSVGLVQTDGLVVFDADGSVRAVSLAPPERVPPLNVRGGPAFEPLRSADAKGLQIFVPMRSPGTGRWVFPLARRLQTASGAFAGAVGAPGLVDYFQGFYGDAYPEPGTRVALLHESTALLARHPPAEEALGRKFPIVTELREAAARGRRVERLPSPVDGVDRYGALRQVPDFPLLVIVTRDAQFALAPWRAQAIGTTWRTLALGLFGGLLLVVVLRQIGRLQAAHALLGVQQERYALAAAGSDDGLWDWDLAAGVGYESRRARQLQGLPLEPETQPLAELQALFNVHPDDAQARRETMERHLGGGSRPYEIEYRVRHPDGEYRWIRVRALCIRDAAGKPLRIAGSVSDIDARKRAEVALRESEQRYALAMTGSNEGHWLWNLPERQVWVSAKLAELMGLPGGEQMIRDETYFGSIPLHPDDRERVHFNRIEHVAGRTPRLDHEFRIVRPVTGEVRWIHTRAQCFRAADGTPLQLAGSTVDATDRKRAEEALRESEERYALAMTGSRGGYWVWNADTDALFVSGALNELFGLPTEAHATTRKAYFANVTLHPDDAARIDALGDDLVAGRAQRADFEYRITLKDGSLRWILTRAQAFRDVDGRGLRIAGVSVDISERKHTEEALRRSEERFQLAVDGSNEGLWDWDLASDQLFFSPRAQQLMFSDVGEPLRPRREWIARTQVHPEDSAGMRRVIAEHLRGRTPHFTVEFRLRHHAGGWHWYRQRGIALRDASGRAFRMAGSMEDITPRKTAEAERDRLEQQLRQAQKLEAIGTLAGGIAHDFNNILAAILGYGELAQRDAPPGTALRRHLDAALAASARAKSLVERILAFSRSGVGERAPVHVQAVVAEALDAVAASLPAGVRLEQALRAGDVGVLGDATQIHQVVLNLCANATQAMKAGGTLAVTVEPVTLAAALPVATNTLAAGDYLRLTVRDSGSGIEPRVLERIFDPFFTTKEVGVGTGLGLSLVHGIVTDLGGGIAVESRVGAGSAFTVWLPSCGPVATPAAADEPIAAGNGETILLVDDEEALVRLAEETLAELGYEPVGFTSPVAALEALRADPQRFDIVLSDEMMPGLTGSELAAEIQAVRPDLPVVLLSGFVSPALHARARAAGVVEVLGKPIAVHEVARCLAANLRRHPADGLT